VIDRLADRLDHVGVARGDGDGALSRRGDELLAREPRGLYLAEEVRTPEPRLREDDRVVLGLDVPLHRGPFEVRQRVEPLLDALVELLVAVSVVGLVGVSVVGLVAVGLFPVALRGQRAGLAGGDQPPLVFRLEPGGEQFL
jgi:hypothetical protein